MEIPTVRQRARLGAILGAGAFALVSLAGVNPAAAMDGMDGEPGQCHPGLVSGTSAPMWAHLQHSHLERAPLDQVADLQATDDYVLLHTAWIEAWSAPAREGLVSILAETPKPIIAHIQKAHLERSPTQQAADLQAFNDYVQLHTVWIENVLQPSVDVMQGSPC